MPGLAHVLQQAAGVKLEHRSVSWRYRGIARVGRGLDEAVVVADDCVEVGAEDASGGQVDRIQTLSYRNYPRDEPPALGHVDGLSVPDPCQHLTGVMPQVPQTYRVLMQIRK